MPTALDVTRAFPLRECPEPQSAFGLDIKSAHKRIRVRSCEQGLLMFQFRGKLYYYTVCPFGAKFSQHWWGRMGSYLVRLFHRFLYTKHALFLFVDDFLLTSPTLVLPVHATFLCLLCQVFQVPVSWTKCSLGPIQTWIGWSFDFGAGLVRLHESKRAKLRAGIAHLLQHTKLKKKALEKFIGLAMWCTSLFPTIRIHLHHLYADLAKPVDTQFSCGPDDWLALQTALDDALVFTTTPRGTVIPPGSKLVSVRHRAVTTLAEVKSVPITDRRIWMRIRDPTTTTRRLSQESKSTLDLLQQWLSWDSPLLSMRPKPLWPGAAFADACANGAVCGVGGFLKGPNGMCWFSETFQHSHFAALPLKLDMDLQKSISFIETLAQFALLHCLVQSHSACRLNWKITSFTDNTGAEARLNSLFSTQYPMNFLLERISLLLSKHHLILDTQHVPGCSNDLADMLSRWDGVSILPPQFTPETRYRVSLQQLWHFQPSPKFAPSSRKPSWLRA